MTKEQLEDLAIEFDECGFEPTTLCDKDYIIKKYQDAFKEMLKDYEILEIIDRWSFFDGFYDEKTNTTYDRFLCNIHTKGMKEDFEKMKEWKRERNE